MVSLSRPARRSITFDRAFEFHERQKLNPGVGTDVWFGDPQEPWPKDPVESLNKPTCRHLPPDAQLSALSNRNMKAIYEHMTGTFTKRLEWRTPARHSGHRY